MDRKSRPAFAKALAGKRGSLIGESLRLLGRPAYFVLVNVLPFLLLGALLILGTGKSVIKMLSRGVRTGLPRSLRSLAMTMTVVFRWQRARFPVINWPKIYVRRRWLAAGFLFLSGLFGIILLGIYLFEDLPTPKDLIARQPKLTTHILDRNGKELYKIYKEENRSLASIRQLPKYVIDATVAIEDKDFWNHAGFSVTGIVRAAYHNWLAAGSRQPAAASHFQGGSTITQQLIKNTLLSPEKTWRRK